MAAAQAQLAGRPPAPCFEVCEAGPAPGPLAMVVSSVSRIQAGMAQRQAAQPGCARHASGPAAAPPLQQRRQQPPPVRQRPAGTAAQLNSRLAGVERPQGDAALRQAVLGAAANQGEAAEGTREASCPSSCIDGSSSTSSGRAPASLASRMRGLVIRVGDMMQPQGEAPGDATWPERTANVLTCLPFFAVGWHMHRHRLTPEGRHHARSMMAVGAAATLYHASSGAARRWARKLDYYTIAYTSSALVKCLFADSPSLRRAANVSLLAVPFRPFAVSAANAALMQTEFARQAACSKPVARDLRRHYTAAALGMAAFYAEDLVMDSGFGGFVHSAWHCLAAYGCLTMNSLIAHKERLHLQRQLAKGGGKGQAGLRRPVHSSASSLPSYGASSAKFSPGLASP